MNLLFLKYNNYYNRIVKQESTIQEYYSKAGVNGRKQILNVNFHEGDLLTTEIIVNWSEEWYPDYLICHEGVISDNNLKHRWFITKTVRTRKGQLTCYLKRDTVADNLYSFLNSTAFIDKGFVGPGNALFLNKDGINANQIKTAEYMIGDTEQNIYLPWVVGYCANNWDGTGGYDRVEIKVPGSTFKWDGWDNFPLKDYIREEGTIYLASANDVNAVFRLGTLAAQADERYKGKYKDYKYNVNSGGISNISSVQDGAYDGDEEKCGNWYTYDSKAFIDWGWLVIGSIDAVSASIPDFDPAFVNRSALRTEIVNSGFTGLNGIISGTPYSGRIKVGSKYYDCIVSTVNESKTTRLSNTALAYIGEGVKQPSTGKSVHYRGVGSTAYAEASKYYSITIKEVTNDIEGTHTFSCNMNTANTLNDAPYKMFCFPLPSFAQRIQCTDGNNYGTIISRDEALQIMSGVVTGLGNNLYDIQVLPYCPIRGGDMEMVAVVPEVAGIRSSSNVKVSWIMDGTTRIAPLYWSAKSTFSFEAPYTLTIDYSNPLKAKRWVNTVFARLVSPNAANTFEFGVVQNNGINGFRIDCQYKPFSPHIHVAPVFGGLYGKNWDEQTGSPYWIDKADTRGLICSGNFSFPQTNAAWVNFELENKNYQLQFNREIDTLELNQQWAERGAVINGVTGAIGGSIKGGATGAMMSGGNPYAAAAGAAVGAATGIVDAVYNYNETKTLGRDAIELKRDMFGYNNQNIQARPNNLTNIGALSPDFRFFPYCEIYQESMDEVQPIENKLKYEGFNIGVVGKISDYVGTSDSTNFIRGSINRIDSTNITASIAQDIAEEFARGLYVEAKI